MSALTMQCVGVEMARVRYARWASGGRGADVAFSVNIELQYQIVSSLNLSISTYLVPGSQ